MCLILLALNRHPDYPLILAANRDEFYARPTLPLHWWQEAPGLLAGQDRLNDGTWFGLTLDGRLAAVTNYREGGSNLPDRPSRGLLTRDFLLEQHPDWELWLTANAENFNGFNLLFGTWNRLFWFSNRNPNGVPIALSNGIHGLSNHLLDTPWPKIKRGKERLAELIHRPDFEADALLELLQDDQPAAEEELPDTGISPEWEQLLSPIFIRSETYGTRASTVLLIDRNRQAQLIERSWTPRGDAADREQCFLLAR